MSKRQSGANAKGRFGTFAGVFTPNVLTILGIILFLRTGWVVGQAGLVNALIIVGIANTISFLTGLSLSSIATSMTVKTGGNYFMISRSLGLEIGGAIGVPLYLSQAISVAFYIIGFTEALVSVEFFQAYDPRAIATVVALLFGVIAYAGADIALKIQFVMGFWRRRSSPFSPAAGAVLSNPHSPRISHPVSPFGWCLPSSSPPSPALRPAPACRVI